MVSSKSGMVLLVDDHTQFRRGAAELVGTQPDFEVVGVATSAEEGVLLAQSLKPDVVLLSLNMRDSDSVDALTRIKDSGLDAQMIMLTVSKAEHDFRGAVRAGVEGYWLKGSESDAANPLAIGCLTSRERQILQLIATGKSNKLIARELNIRIGTVKVHVKNLLRKLNLQSRLEVAVWALRAS